jgi:hypothetical protein
MERADIRMRDARDGASFLSEAFDPVARRGHQLAREQLEGDGPVESRIASPVDLTHSPGTERCQDLEWAEAGAGSEPHRNWGSISGSHGQFYFPQVSDLDVVLLHHQAPSCSHIEYRDQSPQASCRPRIS